MNVEIQNGEGSASIRVAALERYHTDDLEGECSKCQRPIFYRPEPPYLIPFICLKCALPLMAKDKQPLFVISSKTARTILDLQADLLRLKKPRS